MSEREPFLVHKVNLEKWRPRAYDVKKDYIREEDAIYDAFSIWKLYDRKEVNYPGGHNLSLELQFRVLDDQLSPNVNLPTDAGAEVSVLLFDRGFPREPLPKQLMKFGLFRRSFGSENKVLRSGDTTQVAYYRYLASDREDFQGYRVELKAKYNSPSSRAKALENSGSLIYMVLVQEHLQTTLEKFS